MLEYRASGFIDGDVAQSVTQVTNNHGSLTKEFNSHRIGPVYLTLDKF